MQITHTLSFALIRLLYSMPLFPCPDHPRARYQTITSYNHYIPKPAEITQTSQYYTCLACLPHLAIPSLAGIFPPGARLGGPAWHRSCNNFFFSSGSHLLNCWSQHTWIVIKPTLKKKKLPKLLCCIDNCPQTYQDLLKSLYRTCLLKTEWRAFIHCLLSSIAKNLHGALTPSCLQDSHVWILSKFS